MKKHHVIELVAVLILIPTFTALSHFYGYWVWGIFFGLAILIAGFFYIQAMRFEKEANKMLAERETQLKTKWAARKRKKRQ